MIRNYLACLFTITSLTLICNTAQANRNLWKSWVRFNPNPDSLTVLNSVSDVRGQIGGYICQDGSMTDDPNYMTACGGFSNIKDIRYPISGPTFATIVYPGDGVTIGALNRVGSVIAEPVFDASFFALPAQPWDTLPPTLPWTMRTFQMSNGGSLFEITDGMELTGRAFTGVGQAQDPQQTGGKLSLRMGGCAGMREVSGQGNYANMVGTLCLNGTFVFEPNFNGIGVSNCTIVLHHPVP